MDDTYLWATCLTRLQRMARDLQARLQEHGMQLQPEKTQFIQSHDAPTPSTIRLGNQTIQAKGPAEPISVFNQRVSFQGNESQLAAHLATKARMAFHKQRRILTSDAPILAKLKLIATAVTTSALWGCESWPVHHTLLNAANAAQYRVVARAMGFKRRPGETGTEHYQRQIRQARLSVYKKSSSALVDPRPSSHLEPPRTYRATVRSSARQRSTSDLAMAQPELVEGGTGKPTRHTTRSKIQPVPRCAEVCGPHRWVTLAIHSPTQTHVDTVTKSICLGARRPLELGQTGQRTEPAPNGLSHQTPDAHDTRPPTTHKAFSSTTVTGPPHQHQAPPTDQKKTEDKESQRMATTPCTA